MSHQQAVAYWFDRNRIRNKSKVESPKDCSAVQRLKICLEHYHDFIENFHVDHHIGRSRGFGMYAFISRRLHNYSTTRLLDDYHHVLRRFYNQFSAMHQVLTQHIEYDIERSIIFQRINRNRQHCAYKNDLRCEYFGGYNASEEVSVQKLMDKIYVHLVLPFDSGYMLSRQEIMDIANNQVEESNKVLHRAIHNSSASMNYVFDRDYNTETDDAVDKPLKAIVQITESKSKLLYKLRKSKRMKYNKFVSQIDDSDLDSDDQDAKESKESVHGLNGLNSTNHSNNNGDVEEEEEEISSPSLYEIDFGFQFKYWSSYSGSTWFIPKKHRNLKTEMTQNNTCFLSFKQFEDDVKLAITFKNCKYGRRLKCKYIRNFNEPSREEIGIKRHAPMTIDHMLALQIFCNYDFIRKHVVASYKKKDRMESDESLRVRHSEYANLGQLLYECIRLYGTNIAKHDGFHMTFYHCFSSRTHFESFHMYFGYPASTSTSLSVINSYCPSSKRDGQKDGLVLQLKKDVDYMGDQHYFDCSWFSDHGAESEKLFLNIMLGFKSILYPALYHNYGQYLNALTALNAMVKGAELNSNILTPLVPKFLQQIIDGYHEMDEVALQQQLALKPGTGRIPQYIVNLFQSQQDNIDSVEINVWLMIVDSYELTEDSEDDGKIAEDEEHEFADNKDSSLNGQVDRYGYLKLHSLFIANDGWIYVDRLMKCCPNAEHIQLYNGNVQTGQILPCITLDESTMNFLLRDLGNIEKNTRLKRISFYNPDENLLSINDILKHYTRWFTELGWNLRLTKERAPFKEDKCDDVRTLIVFK